MWTRNRVLVLVFAVTILLVGTTFVSPSVQTPPDDPEDDDAALVSLGDTETEIWPYVSSREGFRGRASALNLLVEGDPDQVKTRLQAGGDGWNETETAFTEEEDENPQFGNDSRIVWADAAGAKRYVYYEHENGRGEWTPQSYQLHRGDYFGGQYHIRAYQIEATGGNWTAVQAHAEHFDWFTLTHTVDSLEEARIDIERDFIDSTPPGSVQRVYHDNGDTHDHDGWTTLVYLLALPLLGSVSFGSAQATARTIFDGVWTHRTRLRVAVFVAPAAVLLGVRFAGIALENSLSADPNTIVAVLYPILVFGTPAAAYVAGRNLDPADGFIFGTLGFGTGVVIDYGFIGIRVLPIEIVLHRVGLAIGIGLVVAGASSFRDFELRRSLVTGGLLWYGLVVAAHYV
jgi:hypothetical protein